nr:TATA-binding protein-associated factor 172-like [Pocillopora verrucosa]
MSRLFRPNRSVHWKYCVLDEGHIIKNGKTKLAKVIKQLRASHRLILSGTPIQSNVLELWSLFDFLMPGFLGSEKQFQSRFGKPILQSRDAKSSSKEQEAGALAMKALHRQVLPFLLRRLKEDALQDLPPKIIQDYYCELSPLQKFKLNIANTVISQDNSSLLTMDTGQLLDLFSVDQEKKREKPSAQQSNATGKTSLKTMIENLGELWDEEQYETEYNLDNFIGSLK